MPTALDIVWCRFPHQELGLHPGPKVRPALVRAVYFYGKDRATVLIEVAYGSSKVDKSVAGRDLVIKNVEHMNCAGLPQATYFNLDRVVKLPWTTKWFIARPGKQTPIVGHLHPISELRLERLAAHRRRQAEVQKARQGIDTTEGG